MGYLSLGIAGGLAALKLFRCHRHHRPSCLGPGQACEADGEGRVGLLVKIHGFDVKEC